MTTSASMIPILSAPHFGVGAPARGWFRRLEDEALHNEVLNRCAIDMLGYEPWIVGFARNPQWC
jgi:hypothetical protein